MIKMSKMCKSFYERDFENKVLKDIDLEVQRNEFVLLYGKSGCGKTTLLNIIGLIDTLTSGRYHLDGVDVSGLSENEMADYRNKKSGYVFQSFFLVPELKVIDNIGLPAAYAGKEQKAVLSRASSLAEEVGIISQVKKYPFQLSGGEKQRAAIARALMNDPETILADEPTGSLDSKNSRIIMEILKRKHNEGKTIIMATHDHSMRKYATKVLYMTDGIILP